MTTESTPGPAAPERTSSPSPLVAVAVTLGLVVSATVAALALGSGAPAGATGLVRFESCEAIEGWVDDVNGGDMLEGDLDDTGAARAEEAAPTAGEGGVQSAGGNESSAADGDADTGADATGGTNTVVEGVDEVDVIDRVGDDRLLVSTYGTLSLVDLGSRERVAVLAGIAPDARITHEDGVVFAAGSRPDGMGTIVQRILVDGDSLALDAEWATTGWLLDARRSGGRLHLVAVDQPGSGVLPFAEGPVACDQVWRPVAPANTPAVTLVVSFDETGPLTPVAAAEIAGSAGNVLVTGSALYIATESWGADGGVTTGLHRFALASLAPTGSGEVPGSVAGPFAMDEQGDHLRVATHLGSGGGMCIDCGVIEPMPVEGVEVGAPPAATGGAVTGAAKRAQTDGEDDDTTTTEPEVTTTTEPEVTTTTEPEVTTTTEPAPTTTSSTVPDTTTSSTTTTSTVPAPPDALAEVFVLDLDGSLDVVGRSGRFGHDYETIQGVRFLGDVAYVVTFRQTDPFYVIDLADPAAPRVVGELQIPGFSAYLHPAGEGRVIGFGPDGNGRTSARLFDVSDPAAPSVIDELVIGDESPIAWDHHAFVSIDGSRFAVPVTDYSTGRGGGAGAVVLDVDGGRLSLVDRAMVAGVDLYAERVVHAPDGTWLVFGYGRLVGTDGSEIPLG